MRSPDVAQLARQYEADVYHFCLGMLRQSARAEDAAQETFLKAQLRLHTLRDENSAKSWLFSIAANVCRDELRRLKRRAQVPLTADLPAPARDEDSDLSVALMDAIDELPVRQRQAILLVYYGDLSIQDAARAMHITKGTLSGQLFKARKTLAECLEPFRRNEKNEKASV